LLRLRPALAGCAVSYVTVDRAARADVPDHSFYHVLDANRDTKIKLLFMAVKLLMIMLIVRPHVVISTGAAHGYFACRFGKWIGARSLFIDSVANAEDMSLSAKMVTSHATQVFSQWPHVAKRMGVRCAGSVL